MKTFSLVFLAAGLFCSACSTTAPPARTWGDASAPQQSTESILREDRRYTRIAMAVQFLALGAVLGVPVPGPTPVVPVP